MCLFLSDSSFTMRSLPFANSGLMTFGWLEHKKRLGDKDYQLRGEGCPHHTAKQGVSEWRTENPNFPLFWLIFKAKGVTFNNQIIYPENISRTFNLQTVTINHSVFNFRVSTVTSLLDERNEEQTIT